MAASRVPASTSGTAPFSCSRDLARRGADQQGGVRLGGQRRAQHRVVQALVLAAEDHPQAAVECVERLERGIDAGGLRIVVEIDAAHLAHELQAMLHGVERADGRGDRRVPDARARRGNGRRQHVLHVVAAADGDLPGGHQQRAIEHQLVGAQVGAGRHLAARAEPLDGGGGPFGIPDAHRVVGVQHREIAGLLGLEEPSLGRGVSLEGVVAVQVILRHVERQADMRAEFRDRLELETGKLEHVPAIVARALHHRRHGRPDVSAHLHRHAGFPQDVADQAGGGGLAVRPGDPDGAAFEERTRPVPLRRSPVRPAARASTRGGRSAGTSGESTIKPLPSKTSGVCCANGTFHRASSSAAPGSWSRGFRSVARTTAPRRQRNSTEAMPDFFSPTTSA